jgi:hypothetical protein
LHFGILSIASFSDLHPNNVALVKISEIDFDYHSQQQRDAQIPFPLMSPLMRCFDSDAANLDPRSRADCANRYFHASTDRRGSAHADIRVIYSRIWKRSFAGGSHQKREVEK